MIFTPGMKMPKPERQIDLTGDEVRALFEELLPAAEIEAFAEEVGHVERDRKANVVLFCRAAVISANTPTGGMQADAMRAYERAGGTKLARSSWYQRFDESFENLMLKLAQRALAKARTEIPDLPGILGGVRDWLIVDSSTAKMRDALKPDWPGAGDYAALKVHQTVSVGCGSPIRYHISPAREHDTKHLVIDESWRGYGLLADLGYASLDRLRACVQHDVRFVIRLKENWKPKVLAIGRGELTRAFFSGTDLDAMIDNGVLQLDGKCVDLDVRLGSGKVSLDVRVVGVPAPKGYCFFLTNLPPALGPQQVASLYRVRWEIELTNKLEKSVYRLDQPRGERTCSVQALLHASLIATIITALLVHRHRLKTRSTNARKPPTQAPLHARLVALALVGMSFDIARALQLEGKEADERWSHIATVLSSSGRDPNWRRRPSVLDTLRGYRRQPLVRRAQGRQSASGS